MTKDSNIIDFNEVKKQRFLRKEKTKKTLNTPDFYDKHLIDSEIDRLRSEFGLDKKEEKK